MTRTTEEKNNAQRIFAAFLLCIFTTACQPDAIASKDKTMINLNSSIWQIVAEVQEQKRLSLEKTETMLNQKLIEETARSNEFFQKYSGQPIQLAQGVIITKIDLRLPRSLSGSPGLLVFNFQGECITLPQVKQQFPIIKISGTPRGGSWEEATTHTATNQWGQISFGFREKNPDCVGYIAFEPEK